VLDPIGKGNDTVRSWNQDALLVVNNGALVITPAYYAFRHVSQYVQPGAVVMGTTGGDALAFKNPDGSIVTVMYNSGSSAAMTTLSVGGKSVQFSIPANGWATYKNQ
jgi:glucosylceramidase